MPPPQAWAQRGRVPLPPASAPRPAPARGGTGAYRVSAGIRRPTVPPRGYAPSYGPGAPVPQRPGPRAPQPYRQAPAQYRPMPPMYQVPPQAYRPVPRPPTPSAPPRTVPAAQWSAPAVHPSRRPAVYGGAYAPYRPAPAAGNGNGPWVAVLVVAIVLLLALLLGAGVVYLGARTTTVAGEETTIVTATPTATTTRTTTTVTTTSATSTGSIQTAAPSGTAALQGNPLFADANATLPRQACSATGWPSDSAAGKRFFDSLSPCLDRAWTAAMSAAGLSYRKPTVLVPTGTRLSSPCGAVDLATEDVAAFYCSSNETLYMPPQGLQVDRYGNQPVIYVAVFAHEYGHHVQLVSGIMAAKQALIRQYGRSSARGLEVSRRLELEAQCFSGLLLKSISDNGGQFSRSDYSTAYDDQTRGDDAGEARDHGTPAHAQAWWDTGYQTNRVARCNTWAASSSDVA